MRLLEQDTYYFNSIKVQLEHRGFRYAIYLALFQFHKGTIRTAACLKRLRLREYFNSIKVQLELNIRPQFTASFFSFQFHKGTIRTVQRNLATSSLSEFQFHKGTIRTKKVVPLQ